MTHRLYTAALVGACALVAVPVWWFSELSYLGAFLTAVGVAVVVAAISSLGDVPTSRRLRQGTRKAARSLPKPPIDDDAR